MRKLWNHRWFKTLTVITVFALILMLIAKPLLRGVGHWLNASDPPQATAMCFVLGGNSFERGLAAVALSKEFPAQKFITTGGNFPYQILCLDTMLLECELTRHWMISNGVSPSMIDTLASAHSTMDESNEILAWCNRQHVHHITVISSAFHLRRVRMVFENKFENAGIKINFHGAIAVDYTDENWWQSEEGLIMTNNELVKLFYYMVKY